ncbi:T9SS type A sorting domain-containing protein [Tenacibaculum finnmarkense]|uniref:T9SS type A sorting domain-containing protein n=1 Tax=Tenacibaculum finnmarkense TaxID=2781243 RepID=UPI001EFB7A6C|nr:T9SS type A sorting domain-containing protein [Tenacibaculum finnmarkense]MCG8786132.1 T9SS type A sorting domain-containing protein [Tenacibaculum finnmarkense]MCG8813366.1 T9SS type A sorting domain-containing protein [Tenacibaculum finnmarkense]
MKQIIVKLLFLIAFTFQVSAQITNYKEASLKEGANFFEIVHKTRKELSEKKQRSRGLISKKQNKATKQFERWVWIWKDRINADGSFVKKENKKEYIDLLLANSNTQAQRSNTVTSWEQIGPKKNVLENGYTAYPGLGRVNVVATDTRNAQIMYAGSAAGGLWKTTDGGTTWLPKTDDLAGLGVTDIIIDPQNSDILYMATGDEDGGHVSSIGLFKSIDAGENWAVTGLTFSLTDNEYIRDLSFAPNSSTTIYALTNNEIQKSTDSGATWVNMNTAPDYSGDNFQTIIFDPNNANKVVVSDAYGGLWYSSDGGANFSEHSVLQGSTQNKLKLTASANDTENFYGITQDGVFTIFRFDNTDTAADKISETTIANFNSQWGYNQCIAVSPTNKDDILVGGVNVYKSTDNGASFSMYLNAYDDPRGVGFYVHPDHHYLSFLADGVTVINSHDGGVHKGAFTATKATGGWTDLSDGLVISQPYNIAITEGLNGDDYMMANQDNDGFSKVSKGGRQKWVACSAGDGTATGIDISDSNIRYLGGTYGALYRTNDGYSSSAYSAVTILSDSNDADFISPLALHPTIAATIYAGHGDVKKSTDRGATWAALNTGLVETSFLDVSLYNGATRIFAIGYLGTDKTLRRSNDDGATWVTISNPASNLSINSVYAVPNTAIVYVTVASYKAGEKIYKSIDNGASWVSISGNMPNIIMKKILVDPNKNNETIYVGTELGLYYTNNTTTNWTKLGAGLPNVIISDIKVSKSNGNVYVGTFGRGMWVYNDQKHFKSVTNNNWSETTNWEGKTLPTSADDVVIKQEQDVVWVNVAGVTVKSLEINNAKLEIKNTNSLTVVNDYVSTINDNTFVSILSDQTDSGVFMVNGNATGNLMYSRGGLLANKWSLISSPVIGQKVKSFATKVSNDIRKNAASKYAISTYNDANLVGAKWEYFDQNVSENTLFENGTGYAVSRETAGAVSFSGIMYNSNLNVSVSSDKWNAIGNPFSAYYPASKRTSENFIANNTSKLASNAQAIYLWESTQNKYVAYTNLASSTQKVLAPGQGFFIKTKASETDQKVVFKKANIGTKTTLAGNNTFSRGSENGTPYVKLFVEKSDKEKIKVNTDIIFSKNATQGFDATMDVINFGDATFDLTSKIINEAKSNVNNEYAIQSVSSDAIEGQIIPLKLTARSKEKVVFSSAIHNLPENIKVFIEDKETAKFHEISNTKNYAVTLSENSNKFGRFYIHFSKRALNELEPKLVVSNLKVYTDHNLLQVIGYDRESLTIDIFDIIGKKVLSKTLKSAGFKGLDLSNLSAGVYIVKVVSGNKRATKKVVVK